MPTTNIHLHNAATTARDPGPPASNEVLRNAESSISAERAPVSAPLTTGLPDADLTQLTSLPWTHESDISLSPSAVPMSTSLPEQDPASTIQLLRRNEPTLSTDQFQLDIPITGLHDKDSVPWSHESDFSLQTHSSTGTGPVASIHPEEETTQTVQVPVRDIPSSSSNKSPSSSSALSSSSLSGENSSLSMIVPPTYDPNPAIGLFDNPATASTTAPTSSLVSEDITSNSMIVPPTQDSNPAIGLFDNPAEPSAISSLPEEDSAPIIQVPSSWEIIKYGPRYLNPISSSLRPSPTPTIEVTSSVQSTLVTNTTTSTSQENNSSLSTQVLSQNETYSSLNQDQSTPEAIWRAIYNIRGVDKRVKMYTDTVSAIHGPERAQFLEVFSEYIVNIDESTNSIATIHKNYLDSLSPTDYTAMEITLPILHEKVRYDAITEMHMRSMALENRKRNHQKRLVDIWGVEWETYLADLLPMEYSEGFLWRLARLADISQEIPNWDHMKNELQRIITTRRQKPKTSKSKFLQSGDIINLMKVIQQNQELKHLLYPCRLTMDQNLVMNDKIDTPAMVQEDIDITDNTQTNLPQDLPVTDNSPTTPPENTTFAVVISKKRKNLLSPSFSRTRNPKRQYIGNKQPRSTQVVPQVNSDRRFFIVDLTIDSIHPVLVEEKIDQLKKAAEQSLDERAQKNIELASEAVGMIMGGQDKDDNPIAREEILERLQLIWDLLEISPTSEEQPGDHSGSSECNNSDSDNHNSDDQNEREQNKENAEETGDEDEDIEIEDNEGKCTEDNSDSDEVISTSGSSEVPSSDEDNSDNENIN